MPHSHCDFVSLNVSDQFSFYKKTLWVCNVHVYRINNAFQENWIESASASLRFQYNYLSLEIWVVLWHPTSDDFGCTWLPCTRRFESATKWISDITYNLSGKFCDTFIACSNIIMMNEFFSHASRHSNQK